MIHENVFFGYDYDDVTNTLIGKELIQDYGFFSTFTLMLTSIMVIYKKFKILPENIDGKYLLRKLKKEKNIDMYGHFFHINREMVINFDYEIPVPFSPDDHHSLYSEKYIKYYKPFFDKYFNLNRRISEKIEEIKTKYNIDSNNSVSVIFRDSDKWTDFGGFNYVSAGAYIRKTREIIENNPTLKVLIQSENTNVVTIFNQGVSSLFFEETSLNNFGNDYPPIPIDDEKILKWSEYYIASLWIHSKSKYLITYTGNSAFFVYLNRGTTKNMFQEITFTKSHNEFFIENN